MGLGRFRYMTVSVQWGGQFRYMTTSVHMRSISVHVFSVVWLRYMWSSISVRHYVDIGTLQEHIRLFYAEGLQMLNTCLVSYVTLLMCNWTFFFTTSNIDHRWPIRERINVNKHWRLWRLLKGRRAPVPSQCTLGMLELRTTATAKSPSKSGLKSRCRYGRLSQHRPAWLRPTGLCCWPASTTPSSHHDWWFNGYNQKCPTLLVQFRNFNLNP